MSVVQSATININKRTQLVQTKYFYMYFKEKNVFICHQLSVVNDKCAITKGQMTNGIQHHS